MSFFIKISLKFVPKGPINNIPALVQIMAWRQPGDKPLSEEMMVNLLTYMPHSVSMSYTDTNLQICVGSINQEYKNNFLWNLQAISQDWLTACKHYP